MRIYLLLFVLLYNTNAFAQQKGQMLTDALQAKPSQAQKDTIKTNLLNKLRINGKFDSALNINTTVLAYSIKRKDTLGQVMAYNNLGDIASTKSDYITAADYYYTSLKLGEAKNDYPIMGEAYVRLSKVYESQENYLKSLDYAKKSLACYELVNEKEEYAYPLYWISCSFLNLGKCDSGFYYANKSLFWARKYNNKMNEALALFTIGEYYECIGDHYSAIRYSLDSKKIWGEPDSSNDDAIYNEGYLGIYYLQLAKTEKKEKVPRLFQNLSKNELLSIATNYLETAIRKSNLTGNKDFQSEFQRYLAETEAIKGKYKEAYLNYKSHAEIKDSIFTQENKNKIAAIENQRAIDSKNKEIENQELQISSQRKQKIFFIGALFLLAVIGGLLYRQNIARKKTNTTLLQLNNELNEANKVKAKFFGILSHDLRSPIANLIHFLRLQKREPGLLSEQQVREREQKIESSATSLLETMEAMLLWSKGQMANYKPEMKKVEVNSLFEYLQRFFSATPSIHLSFSNPQNLSVITDENYLQTIMHNLTANAIKALDNTGNGTIEWKAFEQNEKTILSIADNGPGITNNQLEALYDETASSGTRHGLGLHIIRDLAKTIGCSVILQPQIKTGATFVLSIY